MVDHVVREGESVPSIAERYGVTVESIWELPENRPLRAAGRRPEILKPGDVLKVPDRELRYEERPTDQRHRFRRKGSRTRLVVRFLCEGEPRAGEPFRLSVDGALQDGTLDDHGELHVPIPVGARTAEVFLGPPDQEERFPLRISHLLPISEAKGVEQRLRNLGFYDGSDGEDDRVKLANAVRLFQGTNDLEPTGRVDEATRAKLREDYGS